MKQLNYVFGMAFLLNLIMTFFCPVFALQATPLRIATYNIWNPLFEEKYAGQNTWSQRKTFVTDTICLSQSDLICLEEVGKDAYLDLLKNTEIGSSFMSIYISHAPSIPEHKEGRDGIAFFYKPEKVTLLKLVQSVDGSRPTHRRDFYVDLKLNEQRDIPVKFRIACTHLDSEKNLEIGNTQLTSLVKDILEGESAKEVDFIVLCGDFNEGEDEALRPRYDIMQQAGFFTDGSIETTRPEALNVRHKGHVDWIYFKKLTPIDLVLLPVAPIGDEKASDHKLTMTDLEIN